MTVFEELTKGMKFSEPVEDIKKNMVKVFEKNFRCPPWNDVYEEGCAGFAVRMPMDSLKKNRQTGAVPDSIRESRYQSRMRPENGGEGTIQNPSAWLPNGA